MSGLHERGQVAAGVGPQMPSGQTCESPLLPQQKWSRVQQSSRSSLIEPQQQANPETHPRAQQLSSLLPLPQHHDAVAEGMQTRQNALQAHLRSHNQASQGMLPWRVPR